MKISTIIANWKMNSSIKETIRYIKFLKEKASTITNTEIIICPPASLIFLVNGLIKEVPRENNLKLSVGGQNCHFDIKGPYTGEISASILKDCFCEYVILGHSERRQFFMESNELIAKKFLAACNARLIPILCIGENLEQREAGVTLKIIELQLQSILKISGLEAFNQAIIAYEPIWSIGTGLSVKPEQADEIHKFIRNFFEALDSKLASNIRIIYGGSIKVSNAKELFMQTNIDGGLIGSASLQAEEFVAICQQAINGSKSKLLKHTNKFGSPMVSVKYKSL